MSFFESWQFRTSCPSFTEDDEIQVYATGFDTDSESLLARVGDSILRVPGGSSSMVDCKLSVRVVRFDRSTSVGEAELLEVLEETEF